MKSAYLNPSQEQMVALAKLETEGPLLMVNLLAFKEHDETSGKSGRELYKEYMAAAKPFLKKAGGVVVAFGDPLMTAIGPVEEGLWDEVLVVLYPSKAAFMGMAQDPEFPTAMRNVALTDSRLWICKA